MLTKILIFNKSAANSGLSFIKAPLWILALILAFLNVNVAFAGVSIIDTTENKVKSDTIKTRKSDLKVKVPHQAKDSITIDLKKKKVFLYGEADLTYEDKNIKADQVVLDMENSSMTALSGLDSAGKPMGRPVFKDKEESLNADKIEYNFKSKRGILYGLVTKEGEGIIYGEKVKKDEFDNVYVKNAKYTTCDADHPHFYINASKIKIIKNKQIVSGPASVVLGDVPTPIILPFGFFPITKGRASGVIIPGYGFSNGQGFFLKNGGYYFGFSDYVDLALTGDIFSQGSFRVQTASTYAKKYKYNGNVNFNYALNQFNTPGDLDFSKQRNMRLVWSHTMDPKSKPNRTFRANVNLGTSNYYALNSFNPSDIVSSTMNSSITFGQLIKQGKANLTANLSHSQNLQTKDFSLTLPEINFDVARFFPFASKKNTGVKRWYEDIGFNYSLNTKNQVQTKDSIFFNNPDFSTFNNGAVHRVSSSTNFKIFKYFSLSPSANYTDYWYLNSIRKTWEKDSFEVITDTVRGFNRGFDFGFNMNLSTRIFGTFPINAKKIKAIRHVITPTLSYNFRPNFADPFFGFYDRVRNSPFTTESFETYSRFQNGIYGGPGSGLSSAIGFDINNNLEMKVRKGKDTSARDEKIKIFEFIKINGSYNFAAPQFKLSLIRIDGNTRLSDFLSVQLGATLDPYALDTAFRRVNEFTYNTNKKLGRLTEAFLTLSSSLNPQTFKKDGKNPESRRPMRGPLDPLMSEFARDPGTTAYELAMIQQMTPFVDFSVPWSLSFNYNIRYSKPANTQTINNVVTFNGDVTLTKNWKFSMSSGYDFVKKELSYTTINIHRDLHCWEFNLSWAPFGFRQYFFFNMNIKSSIFRDVKINRRRDWYDNQ